MVKRTDKIDKQIVITNPLDMEGTILVFLRNMFKNEIFEGLKWSPHENMSQITIDVADRINQEKTSVYPAIFVSTGALSYQTVGLRDGFEQRMNLIAKTNESGAPKALPTVTQSVTLQQFPVTVSVYSSKTESYKVAYYVTKLILAFKSAILGSSNLHSIESISLGRPTHRPDVGKEIYSCSLGFSCSFFDIDRLPDVAPFLRQAYMTVKVAQADGNDFTDMQYWLTETDEEE